MSLLLRSSARPHNVTGSELYMMLGLAAYITRRTIPAREIVGIPHNSAKRTL
jgi:hypothetical protein